MGFGRRRFVGLAAGLAAGAALSPAPWDLARDAFRRAQDRPDLPRPPHGPLEELPTTSLACPSGQGVLVLMAQGRPVLARGRVDHPLSGGAATPLAQSEPRDLYHPDRVRGPLLKKDGAFVPVSWAAALDILEERLRGAGGRVLAVGPDGEGVLRELLDAFLERLGAPPGLRAPDDAWCAAQAARLLGVEARPGYDLDNAGDLILAGADAFGGMPAAPRFRQAWAARAGQGVCLGPVRPEWAALCERFIPMTAGSGAFLAMGLARRLAERGRVQSRASDTAAFLALASARFGPDEVARATGVSPEDQEDLALRVARGALFAPGSPAGAGAGPAPFVAGYALMLLAGTVNRPGGLFLTRPVCEAPAGADLAASFRDLALAREPGPDVLLLVESDPLARLPGPELASRAMARASFRAAFTPLMTASSRLCDLILPAPMPLERWGDVATPHGLAFASYGMARPLLRPVADARHPGDVLAALAARLGRPLGFASFRAALDARVEALEAAGGYVARAVPPWRVLAGEAQPAPQAGLWEALASGGLWCDPRPVPEHGMTLGAHFLAEALAPEPEDLNAPLRLAAGPGGNPGREPGYAPQASPPVARLNAATAARCRVAPGEKARLRGREGEVLAVAALDETVADGHVAVHGRAALAAATTLQADGATAWDGCPVALEKA